MGEPPLRPVVDPVVIAPNPTKSDLHSLARLLLVLREPLSSNILARLDPGRLVAFGLVLSTSAARGCAKTDDDWQLCASDIDLTAPLLKAAQALSVRAIEALKAALHRIVHLACTNDDLLPHFARGFTRSLFVLFGALTATINLSSTMSITGKDPLSFLSSAETVIFDSLSHYCDMQEQLATERPVWQASAMYNLLAAATDLFPTLERLLSALRDRVVASDNRAAYAQCAARFNAAATRVCKLHVARYLAPLKAEAKAFLLDSAPAPAPTDALPPLSALLDDTVAELSAAFSRDVFSSLVLPVYLSEIGVALDALLLAPDGRPLLGPQHLRRMQILTDAVRAAFRKLSVAEESVEAAVSRHTAFLTLMAKADDELLRIRDQLTDPALFALLRALLEGRNSPLVPHLAVVSPPTGFKHALAVGLDSEPASIPALLDPTQPSPALSAPFAPPPASSTAVFSVPLAVAVARSRSDAPPPRGPGRASLTLLSCVPSVVVECVALLSQSLPARRCTLAELTPDASVVAAVATLQALWDGASHTDLAMRSAEWAVLYGLLCRFFQCLPEPLVPPARFEACMALLRLRLHMGDAPADADKWAALFTRHLSLLPNENRATLLYLLRFLRLVVAHTTAAPEAAVLRVAETFAPAILRPPSSAHPSLLRAKSERAVQLAALLIEEKRIG